ncbi:MAG: hypothetical protein M1838_001442 [Thelocarpon superellum]|nr:MAG: hypothetical protein M1838_001442 [Thelocarpon superellum]
MNSAESTKMQIGVAIIGSGIFAKEEHLPAVRAAPHLVLRAAYSRFIASAKALVTDLPGGVDLYADDQEAKQTFPALLARADIQAVIIALPILVQPDYIRAALQAGKHVLSEKPIAADQRLAEELLSWYHNAIDTKSVTWAVAENYRYLDGIVYGREQVQTLGKVLGVHVTVFENVKLGGKYIETSWRKQPGYQGGFLLDGGVHFVAATRYLLGPSNAITRISAQTTQLQPHLPPVDTLDATLKLATGGTGTFSVSFGTTLPGWEYSIACEGGSVTVGPTEVTVRRGEGENQAESRKAFPNQGMGVKQEVKAWAEGLHCRRLDGAQTPLEALRDLEILELMLQSGEKNGLPMDISKSI